LMLVVRVTGSPDISTFAHISIFPEVAVTNVTSHKVALVSVRVIDAPVAFCTPAGVLTGTLDTGAGWL
jgi:hypothetical protein